MRCFSKFRGLADIGKLVRISLEDPILNNNSRHNGGLQCVRACTDAVGVLCFTECLGCLDTFKSLRGFHAIATVT